MKHWLCVGLLVVGAAGAGAQSQIRTPEATAQSSGSTEQSPTFRTGVTLVRTDVIVRDADGAFVPDLGPADFIVKEDGVAQEVASLVLVHGGRVYTQLLPPVPTQEGIILPSRRATNNTAGRVIIFFVDELHLRPELTPKLRHFIKEVASTLVHEGDLVGLVSNGPANTSVELTYDRALLNSAANQLTGRGLGPRELIMETQNGSQGPAELRWNAHRAFWTVNELLKSLETLEDRRKVLLYVSTGYDVNPFSLQRLYRSTRRDEFLRDRPIDLASSYDGPFEGSRIGQVERQGAIFADGELIREMDELTQAANRANTTFYTMDPRGLISSPDIDFDVPLDAWREYTQTTRSSLRTLAELTGGFSIVNTNNFDDLLAQIDAETSDYYVLGYYASNPNAFNQTRELSVDVSRPNLTVRSRGSYTFRPTTAPIP